MAVNSTPSSQTTEKKPSSLLGSSMIVAAMTGLSRILGLARDTIFAIFLGAGAGVDAFIVAFKIPNFLRRLFAEGAFSQAFIPVLAEYKEQGSVNQVHHLLNRVAGTLGGILALLSILGMLAAPLLIYLFAPGFTHEPTKLTMAADMLRITFPYLFFISLTAFASATLNAYQLFWAPAFAPVLLNLSLISCAIWLAPQLSVPVYALAWGVFFAGIAQLCFQLPFLFKRGLLPKPYWGWNDSGVQKILKLMLPVLFGVGVSQINLLLDTIIASFLRTGSIAWLYYSDRLLEFPLGVLAIALGTVILPNLSKQHASRNPQEFSATLDWGVRSVILVGLPAALSLFLLAFPMLTTFFQYRQFSLFDATMASHSLQAFALGLVAMMLIKILAPAYFARQDTKRPVRYGVMAMITNMVLNLILVFGFDLGHVGLALATSLSAWLNAGLLFIGLWRDRVFQPGPGWLLLLVRLLVALGLLTTFLLISLDYWHQWATWSWSVRVSRLLAICLAGSVLYLLSLWLLGMRVNQFKPASHYYQAYLKKEVSP